MINTQVQSAMGAFIQVAALYSCIPPQVFLYFKYKFDACKIFKLQNLTLGDCTTTLCKTLSLKNLHYSPNDSPTPGLTVEL